MVSIEGISIKNDLPCTVCEITDFSDEIKSLITDKLTKICYGESSIDGFEEYYSYEKTLKEFYKRFEKKTFDTKKGMIGELLTHLFFEEVNDDFKVISIFFNKEEKSIRKGFDLTFCNLDTKKLWYSEVKSGHCTETKNTSTAKTIDLLTKAKNDVKNKFSNDNSYLWESAITDLELTINENDVKYRLKKVLLEDQQSNISQNDSLKNVILISVLFEDLTNEIILEKITELKKKFDDEEIFDKIILFSIHKGTYEKIEQFLFGDITNE